MNRTEVAKMTTTALNPWIIGTLTAVIVGIFVALLGL